MQDTLAAALTAQGGFTGKSSVKTWLTGILKHKIVDAIRRKQRDPVSASTLDEDADLEDFEGLFKETAPGSRRRPTGAIPSILDRQQFFDVMQVCLDKLPPNTARVFMMREVMELDERRDL